MRTATARIRSTSKLWGENVGWDDQAFGLDIAKPGTYYLTFGWDETPHVWSQKAHSIWSGVGGNFLTVNVFTPAPAVAPNAVNAAIIANGANDIDLKIRRDTASAAARWTPTDNWDVTADYSHMQRRVCRAAAWCRSRHRSTRTTFEIPKPVDDVTQNANLKGEYCRELPPWGKPFNLAIGGGFSTYTERQQCHVLRESVECDEHRDGAPLNNQYSLSPDNQAGSVSVQGGVGLPLNSRYMGTFQCTRMTADASNLPFTVNPLVVLVPGFSNDDAGPADGHDPVQQRDQYAHHRRSDVDAQISLLQLQRREYAGDCH